MKLDVFFSKRISGKEREKASQLKVVFFFFLKYKSKPHHTFSPSVLVQVQAPVVENAWKDAGSRKPLPLCAFVGAQELCTLRIQVHIEGKVS